MEMKLFIQGIGLGVPRTPIAASVASVCYIRVRESPIAKSAIYMVHNHIDIGEGSGNDVVYGGVGTEWFRVREKEHPWIANMSMLEGKEVQVEVSGILPLVFAKADVKISFVDEHKNRKTLMDKVGIAADGWQISATQVSGPLRKLNLSEANQVEQAEKQLENAQ